MTQFKAPNGRKGTLPQNVINDIKEYRKENGYEELTDFEINYELDIYEALSEYLLWNGIIGYTCTIANLLDWYDR